MTDPTGETARPFVALPNRERRRSNPPPLPSDAPLLTFADVAAYLRLTPAAVKRLLDGRRDGSDADHDLGNLLRSWLVALSERRRYIRREPFLTWLREKSSAASGSSAGG